MLYNFEIWFIVKSMINFFIKNAIRQAAIKLAKDKSMRSKVVKVVNNANELNKKGELLKTLGKSAGRLKSKLYK